MADIDILFSTNAPQVTAEIDRATTATGHAEVAAGKMTAKSSEMTHVFREVGKAAGAGGSAIGKAFGVGGMLGGAISGVTILAKTIEIATAIIDRQTESSKNAAEGMTELTNRTLAANTARAQTGASAVEAQAGAMRELVGRGGDVKYANDLAKDSGVKPEEAMKVIGQAMTKFGTDFKAAIEVVKLSAEMGGPSMSAGLVALDKSELGNNKVLTADRIAQAKDGLAPFSQEDGEARLSRVRGNVALQGAAKYESLNAERGVLAQNAMALAPKIAHEALAKQENPAAYAALEAHKIQEQQLTQLKKIADEQGALASIIKGMIGINARQTYQRAVAANADKNDVHTAGVLESLWLNYQDRSLHIPGILP